MKRLFLILLLLWLCIPRPVLADPAGYVIIPKIGLYKSVHFIPDSDLSTNSYFYNLDDLHYGVGYLDHLMWGNTSGGRTVLVGHTPGAFEDLGELSIGDEVVLAMNEEYYSFIVFDMYVTDASDGSILYTPCPEFEVVLITCRDRNQRLIVRAK